MDEANAVSRWDYLRIDLNQRGPREDELDLLNRAGAEGWELVGISATNIAYLKRLVDVTMSGTMHNGQRATSPIGAADDEQGNAGHEVAIKYRDPLTGDTWTGRGRMARWLKAKQDDGQDIRKYLVEPE